VRSEYDNNVVTVSQRERFARRCCTVGTGLAIEETIEFEALDALRPFDDNGNIAWTFEGEATTRPKKRWLELYQPVRPHHKARIGHRQTADSELRVA
jgi:hypothetical protein